MLKLVLYMYKFNPVQEDDTAQLFAFVNNAIVYFTQCLSVCVSASKVTNGSILKHGLSMTFAPLGGVVAHVVEHNVHMLWQLRKVEKFNVFFIF